MSVSEMRLSRRDPSGAAYRASKRSEDLPGPARRGAGRQPTDALGDAEGALGAQQARDEIPVQKLPFVEAQLHGRSSDRQEDAAEQQT